MRLPAITLAMVLSVGTQSPAASISGKVVDEQGKPLAGVRVTALPLNFTNCCGNEGFALSAANGTFLFDVSSGVHAVVTSGFSQWNPAAARVDTTSSDATGLVLRLTPGLPRFIPDDAPRAALIAAAADESGLARVAGAAGAVPASSYVILVTLETGELTVAQANADGGFSIDHFAPAGTSILVKADAIGMVARNALLEAKFGGEGALGGASGTIIRVPEAPSQGGSIAFSGAGAFACCSFAIPPVWTFATARSPRRHLRPEKRSAVRGTLEARTSKFTSIPVSVNLVLETIADDLGSRGPAHAYFSSAFTTPTGFPIERGERALIGPGTTVNVTLSPVAEGRLSANVDIAVRPSASVRAGWFRPRLEVYASSIPNEAKGPNTISVDKPTRFKRNWMGLPVISIGTPPSPALHWVLLLDQASEGVAGVAAVEDRGAFGMTNRIAMSGETFVVPRVDPVSGAAMRYRLEPFLPQISIGDRGIPPSVPFIPFKFPSGKLTVRVRKPDGAVVTAGPAPFVQSRMSTIIGRDGWAIDPGGGHLTDPYQITTRNPAFEVAFESDGLHLVELEGEIEDLWGHRWSGRGTYRIHVGRPIAVDTATIPGTPFEVGDAFDAGATIAGWSACDVTVDVALNLRRWTIRGRTNRYGAFQPSEPVRFTEPGEYRADVMATCTDDAGNAGVGTRTWGGVVAPREPRVILHGRRGIDDIPGSQQWFFRSQTPGQPIPHSHVNYPFHSGDVLWMVKNDATTTAATLQDLDGSITALLRDRWGPDKARFDAKASIGQIPLFSSRADLLDPAGDPSKVDLWAYSYRAAERPAVRVREQVTEEDVPSMYWRFHAQYGRQAGVGRNGDLRNDFKFQFAGAVLRGAAIGNPVYAIYGSLFVLVADDDAGGTRAFPPFQGNGGGPNGGPLFTLKGKPIDLFFHPTGLRPGTILVQGDTASFAGYSAPTLASKVEIMVTAPSGRVRTIKGQANRIGWLYDPAYDFAVDEPGVWKAKVNIFFDGVLPSTSGQVQSPFPTGDVLGSREGEFFFYVVRGGAAPLALAAMPRFVRPGAGPVTFTVVPPSGLSDVQLAYTATMPGFILEEGTTGGLTYTYEARRLVGDFPNLDLSDEDGYTGVDTITFSFLLSGTDAAGVRKHFARQIVLQGEELQMPEQIAAPSTPRRRAVK